jgi:hypothetical protein
MLITNQLLYHLSYAGIYLGKYSLMRLLRVTFYTSFLYRYVRRLQRLHFGFPRSAPAPIRTVLAFQQRDIRSMHPAAAAPFHGVSRRLRI